MAENMFSAEEAAELLGLQVRTVRNYVRDGRLPGIRIGKQYRIARADLEAFTAGVSGQQTLPGYEQGLEPQALVAPTAEVSSIVQVDGVDAGMRDTIERTLEVALLAGPGDTTMLRADPIYDDQRRRLKIVLVGELQRVTEVMSILATLTADRQ
jgi:excisionase family DNA binding protein